MKLYKPVVEAQKFWNPHTQTMPRADLDRLHLRKLQTVIEYAYARSPMYRKLLDRHKVKPEQIRTKDDFVKRLPFIDKKEILDAQSVSPPFADVLAIPEDFFHQRFATSGSTSAPLHIPLTYHSAELWGESWVYLYWAAGIRARHSFYFPFNWGIFAAFWSAYMGVRRLGATVVSGGGLDTKARLRQIEQYRPDVMLATPTYALYLGETAREIGVDLAKTSISIVIVSGEPGGSIPATRHAIEDLWGARCYELYGIAEIGPTNQGCPLQEGVHLCEDWTHALVVDESGNHVPYGEVHVDSDTTNDFVTVKAEVRPEIDGARYAELGRDAAGVFKSVICVSIDVTVQAPGSLPRYELKAKRFFDHRPAGHRWQLAGR